MEEQKELKKEPQKVSKKEFTELVEKGYSVKELAEYYGLSVNSTRSILATLGLKCKRKTVPVFVLIVVLENEEMISDSPSDIQEVEEQKEQPEQESKNYYWVNDLQN